jgi:hypothetical protein
MPVQVDLTGVSVEGPTPLEPDTYDAVITKADIHPSKSSQNDTLYLEIAVGEEGRNLRWNCSVAGDSLWRFKKLLVRLGFEIPEGPFEFDEKELIGAECQVKVSLEPHYQDPSRKTNKITAVLGPDGEEGEGSWG